MSDETLSAFMDATGCGYEDAFQLLASCGGHLGQAVNRFFSIDAGPSGTSRSPPPSSSPPLASESEAEEEAPAPARSRAHGGSPSVSSRRRVSRWDSEKRVCTRSSRRRRRRRGPSDRDVGGSHSRGEQTRRSVPDPEHAPSRGGSRKSSRRRRRSRVDTFASNSDNDEEEVEANNGRRRRRLNPTDLTSDDGEEEEQVVNKSSSRPSPDKALALTSGGGASKKEGGSSRQPFRENNFPVSSDDHMKLHVPPPRPPPSKSDKDDLFRVPHGLRYKGGFHDAKVHAARRARWLLVNVQSLELPSLAQNRDVWGSDLVAQCVRDHFVLWQADADTDEHGGEGEEARKVLCYYNLPRDRLPVVVVVDPVTGQAVDKLHGTDPNDFVMSMAPYTDMKPIMPGGRANKSGASAAAQNNKRSATAAAAPMSQQQQQAAATAAQQPALAANVCKLRVRLPDGRVVAKEFGSYCAVAELFAYCRSELGAGAAAGKPFRLLRFDGAAREEIGNENANASFERLKLHMSTVSVELGTF